MNLTEENLLKRIHRLENIVWESHQTNSMFACDCIDCTRVAIRRGMVMIGKSKWNRYWAYKSDIKDSKPCKKCTLELATDIMYAGMCQDCYWENV